MHFQDEMVHLFFLRGESVNIDKIMKFKTFYLGVKKGFIVGETGVASIYSVNEGNIDQINYSRLNQEIYHKFLCL